jgi:cell division protein FtsA
MKSSLTLIIEARMIEIFELIREAVKRSGYFEYLNAGAVITGGGSLIPGTDTLSSNILGLDVRTGFPEGVSGGIKGAINNPIYATVMGLVAYSFENSDFQDSDVIDLRDGQTESVDAEESHPEGETGKKIVDRLKDWWEKL